MPQHTSRVHAIGNAAATITITTNISINTISIIITITITITIITSIIVDKKMQWAGREITV